MEKRIGVPSHRAEWSFHSTMATACLRPIQPPTSHPAQYRLTQHRLILLGGEEPSPGSSCLADGFLLASSSCTHRPHKSDD